MSPDAPAPLLAIDTSSPVVSVAVGRGGSVLATRAGAQRESSARLLRWIEAILAEAGIAPGSLGGLVALAGPGSFTGLRVGLATALGLHQALGLPAATLPTLGVLAAAAPAGRRALAVVPALPGEWFAQPWSSDWPPRALGEARRVPGAALAGLLDGTPSAAGTPLLVGAPGVELAEAARAGGLAAYSTGELAPVAARLAALHPPPWDAAALTRPLYLAPPPVTVSGAPKRVLPPPREGS
jgi:tRNA threonylcarbamoyl adenosine modification protein YeaZ